MVRRRGRRQASRPAELHRRTCCRSCRTRTCSRLRSSCRPARRRPTTSGRRATSSATCPTTPRPCSPEARDRRGRRSQRGRRRGVRDRRRAGPLVTSVERRVRLPRGRRETMRAAVHGSRRGGRRDRRARRLPRPRGLRAARARGRRREIDAEIVEQMRLLQARPPAGVGRYVKPHGALYHRASVDPDCARAVVAGMPGAAGRSPCSASRARAPDAVRARRDCSPSRKGSPTVRTRRTGRSSAQRAGVRCSSRRGGPPGGGARRGRLGGGVAVDLRARRLPRGRAARRGGGARSARLGARRAAAVRMTAAIRPAGDRGALIELPDSAAAVRVARALAGRSELVDVVPGHRTVLVTWAAKGGRVSSRLPSLPRSRPARRWSRGAASRSRSSTTARTWTRSRGSQASRPRRWPRGTRRRSTSSRSSASRRASPISRAATRGSTCRGSSARASGSPPGASRSPGPTPASTRATRRAAGGCSAARPLTLFDPKRTPPALLAAGDRVRFLRG